MIIAAGTYQGGKEIVVLGLSQANIDMLLTGHPIRITQESHPGNPFGDTAVLIVWGPTEADIVDDFRK